MKWKLLGRKKIEIMDINIFCVIAERHKFEIKLELFLSTVLKDQYISFQKTMLIK